MGPLGGPSVAALVYDRLTTFEFGIVADVFGLQRPGLGVPWYDFSVCSLEPGPLRATGGITVRAEHGLEAFASAHTIIIPGWRDPERLPPDRLIEAVRGASQRGARLVSVCSGVFVLAAAGLLDGRRATTHWRYTELLRLSYPAVQVEPDVLYVDEGDVLTSAGSAAGLDLCLHIVGLDYGVEIANEVARSLLVPPHRDGGQAQYVSRRGGPGGAGELARVMDWAIERATRSVSVGEMAAEARMSPRNFARRFLEQTGVTPHRWLTHQRLLLAQRSLEMDDRSIEDVAESAGFGTAATLRHHFRRTFGTTPTAYRRRFSAKRPTQAPPDG